MDTLSKESSLSFLAMNQFGHLGCISNGLPYVIPVNYVYEDGYAYSHSLPGKKLTALRENPTACLQVDDIVNSFKWISVVANCFFEEIKDSAGRKRVLNLFLKRFPELTPVESRLNQDDSKIVVFSLRITDVSGRSEGE